MRRRGRLVLLALLVLLPSCAVHGLNFKQDKRLAIISPKDRAKVRLPVTIRWTVHDFTVTGRNGEARNDAGYFGVYVDREPQPPGETQFSLVKDLPDCRRDRKICDNADYLAQADINSVTTGEFTVAQLPAPPTDAAKRREFHSVTIAFLNGRGERVGESAYRLQFEVDRSGTS